MKYLILLSALTLTGCRYNGLDKNLAEFICKDSGGLFQIKPVAVAGKVVVCNDNSRHELKGIIDKEWLEQRKEPL